MLKHIENHINADNTLKCVATFAVGIMLCAAIFGLGERLGEYLYYVIH